MWNIHVISNGKPGRNEIPKYGQQYGPNMGIRTEHDRMSTRRKGTAI